MDRLIMALLLSACAALTAYALRVSAPIQAATAAQGKPVILAQASPDATHAAPVTEQAAGPGVNIGVFDKSPHEGPHEGMDHAGSMMPAAADEPVSTQQFRAVNAEMHKNMSISFTGDADADFVRGMIPHHQGAIEMAKIVLAHGKDPEIRKLAESIIAAQNSEVKFMGDWLKKTGK